MERDINSWLRGGFFKASMRAKSHIYVALAAICFGTIGVLVKLVGGQVHPLTLNFYRVFLAFIFLLLVVPFIDKKALRVGRRDLKDYFFVGLLMAVSLSLYVLANFFAPIQNVVLIQHSYPFFVLVFAYFLLRERITITKTIALIFAVVGLLIINPFDLSSSQVGNFVAFTSALSYGLLVTEMRKEDKTHTVGDVVWFFFFATILLLPFPFLFGFGDFVSVLPHVLVLGILSTGLAYLFYNLALEELEAELSSIIVMVVTPLVSILLAVAVVNEPLSPKVLLGGILLLVSGLYLETSRYASRLIRRLEASLGPHHDNDN